MNKEEISIFFKKLVFDLSKAINTKFREPIVGFSSTSDKLYDNLKIIVGKHHYHPKELFKSGETVISYFLPFEKVEKKLFFLFFLIFNFDFQKDIVLSNNSKNKIPSSKWGIAFYETTEMTKKINNDLGNALKKDFFIPPVELDKELLMSKWYFYLN